jgi:hypothetical protein
MAKFDAVGHVDGVHAGSTAPRCCKLAQLCIAKAVFSYLITGD